MSSAMEKLKSAKAKIEAARAESLEVGITALNEAADQLFVDHPVLYGFRWTQYTPYFNDGDPCKFSINEVKCKMKDPDGALKAESEDEEDADEEFIEACGFRYDKDENDPMNKAATAAEQLVNDIGKDILESLFGDHVEVTRLRGASFETDDYEHD